MEISMKKIILLNVLTILIFNWSCESLNDTVGGTIEHPNIESIIPLDIGRSSTFQWNIYDTDENTSVDSTAEYYISIEDVLVFDESNNLVSFDFYKHSELDTPFIYKYEQNQSQKGSLISYLSNDSIVKGIYQFGNYTPDTMIIYDTPKMWIKYPGKTGDSWNYISEDSSITKWEIIDTKSKYSIPSQYTDNISPVIFLDCYLLKSTKDSIEAYHYFNKNYGLVGYLEYINSKLCYSAKLIRSY